MKKYHSVNKRNGRKFILTFNDDNTVLAYDIEKKTEKAISLNTVKRWHEVGEEIKPEQPKKKAAKKSTKAKGKDKRKKVTEEQVREIREKKKAGASISSLAKEYGLSYSGMYWIVKGNTWAKLDKEEQTEEQKRENLRKAHGHFWYEYKHRGYSPGCQPKGVVAVDHNHGRFGAIAYKEQLTEKQISDYELIPMQ